MGDTEPHHSGSRTRSENPGRRRTDHSWFGSHIAPHENWYRDFWLFVITIFTLWAAIAVVTASHRLVHLRHQLQEGRRFAVTVTCAFGNAVEEAGRAVILGGGKVGSPRFVRNLEALGFHPPPPRQLKLAAGAYVTSISRRVQAAEQQVGGHARLVRSDGTLDCAALARLADARAR